MSLRTATCNLLLHAVLRAATKQTRFESSQKKVQSIKVFTNDSIGTFSPGLYILYLLKLPAPPRADLSGNLIYTHIKYICIYLQLGQGLEST